MHTKKFCYLIVGTLLFLYLISGAYLHYNFDRNIKELNEFKSYYLTTLYVDCLDHVKNLRTGGYSDQADYCSELILENSDELNVEKIIEKQEKNEK